jgi:predicted NBD/HSP70 family sugar kinase
VQELRERKLVVESGVAPSTGGRPPRILDLTPDLGGVLAVDIGGINLRFAAADVRARFLTEVSVPTPTSPDPDVLREAIVGTLASIRDRIVGEVRAIAVAVAGVVDPETQTVSLAVNVPGWRDVDLKEWLSSFDAPVLVDNEANLAAVGEHSSGCARGVRNVLFVAVGAGVGAGLILNGVLFRGATGAAGEVGYLRKSLAGPAPQLEWEAAAGALVRRYLEHGGDGSLTTAKEIFDQAAAGDRAAAAAVSEVIDELAIGIANAIAVIDPELVVIGGGVAAAGVSLIAPLRERIAELVPSMPTLLLSELGPHAALVGATSWAAQHAQAALARELDRVSAVG